MKMSTMNNFRRILIISCAAIIVGCSTQQQRTQRYNNIAIIPTDETRNHPDYPKHFSECYSIAMANQSSVGTSAATGAVAGAALASAFGLILGVDSGYGQLAGVGALSGGLSGAAGSAISNDMRYKQIMVQCLRDRGHHVY